MLLLRELEFPASDTFLAGDGIARMTRIGTLYTLFLRQGHDVSFHKLAERGDDLDRPINS
jgi:hypothetical protein